MWKPGTVVRTGALAALGALVVLGCASSRYPEVSEDGLIRVHGTPFDAAYEAPGSDLGTYGRVAVDECTVRFRSGWLGDQNRDRGPSRRVTEEDMEAIARRLARACRDVLTAELTTLRVAEGSGRTLVVRPAIVDLDVAAPDVLSPGRESTFTTTAGRMTLRLDLVDADTGEVQGRLIDRRELTGTAALQQTSRIRNMAEAERVLREWAIHVRGHLQAAAG
jgi:hypothetical protein